MWFWNSKCRSSEVGIPWPTFRRNYLFRRKYQIDIGIPRFYEQNFYIGISKDRSLGSKVWSLDILARLFKICVILVRLASSVCFFWTVILSTQYYELLMNSNQKSWQNLYCNYFWKHQQSEIKTRLFSNFVSIANWLYNQFLFTCFHLRPVRTLKW